MFLYWCILICLLEIVGWSNFVGFGRVMMESSRLEREFRIEVI